MRRRPLLPRRCSRSSAVDKRRSTRGNYAAQLLWRRMTTVVPHVYCGAAAATCLLLRHLSTLARPGYPLRQPQLAAAVDGPVRILPQFESFYRVHQKNPITQLKGVQQNYSPFQHSPRLKLREFWAHLKYFLSK